MAIIKPLCQPDATVAHASGGWRLNRWNRHGSLPLAGAGIVIGVISRGGGQSPVTHDVVYAVAAALLLAALLCALVGAAVASTARSGLRG